MLYETPQNTPQLLTVITIAASNNTVLYSAAGGATAASGGSPPATIADANVKQSTYPGDICVQESLRGCLAGPGPWVPGHASLVVAWVSVSA